ncbi:hypothetical protein ACJX0J_012841 [Zea mays]
MYGELHVLEEKFESKMGFNLGGLLFMYQGGIPHVGIFQILFWTEVFLWSSVIFQIFGAIFKMGDHEVRAQSNPIQTTWACCVKNKEKGGAELENNLMEESLFCFTVDEVFFFGTADHVLSIIVHNFIKMGDHEVRAQSNPIQTTWACCVKNKEKRGAELEVSVDPKETYEKGNCFTRSESNIPLGHLLVKEQELIMSSNLSKEYIKN